MTEPQCVEVEMSTSTGGKVQVVKFNLQNDYEYSYGERYQIPSDWSPERLDEWSRQKVQQIKAKVDQFAQDEQDALLEASDWYN